MILTIKNSFLRLQVDTFGAQMMSILSASGREYLWQGDPRYWSDRALTLFPFIARLTGNQFTLNGKPYTMQIHGLAPYLEFTPVEQTDSRLVLELQSGEETRSHYPFDFAFRVCFSLEENRLSITYQVDNRSEEVMPFALGGHPGFFVGREPGENFEDYTLEFSQPCRPDRVGFTPDVFVSGKDEAYPLEDDCRLPLRHGLFDEDAVILKNMARSVTLKSSRHSRTVTVSYPDFPILGLWHWPKTDAPYVCIEPWSSLPARQDVVEELMCKSDLLRLNPGRQYQTTWSVTIDE